MGASNRVEEKDNGLKKFFKNLNIFDGLEVVVGLPAAQGSEARGETTMATIAASHEYGIGVPQRSFLRDTFDINAKKYGDLLVGATKKVLKNANPKRALFILGETARGDVITRINQGILPENSPATIARKGSSLPLVDTGQMRGAIKALVREETKD